MKISELSVRRPVLMTMVYVLIAIIAAVYILQLDIALIPDTDLPVISVIVDCDDAGPELIEQQVARPLENALSSIENLEDITSMSSEGSCFVVLEFAYGTNLDDAEEDVNSSITMLTRSLPDWAGSPQVMRMDSINTSQVMTLSVTGDYDIETLQQIAEDDISPLIERIDGVADTDVYGGSSVVYEVQVHADRMEAFGLSFSDISSALSARDVQSTAGEITENGTDYQIALDERYADMTEIENTVITTVNGTPIRISDVADVVQTSDDNSRESYIDGEPVVSISVTASSDSNETTVAGSIREALPSIREALPEGISLEIQRDQTEMITDTMGEVCNSAWQGVVLAAAVIFIFLRGFKTTLIISLSMPICILITLMCMSIAGISVNSMSMAGLILGIGMIVDASIIILENTYSFRLKGEQSAVAAILGSKDMFNAILGSTLTTICVFLPLLIYKNELEMIGIMFQDMIITVCLSLGCSLFVAVTLVPALCGSILKINTRTQRPLRIRLFRAVDDVMVKAEDKLRDAYARLLSFFLDHKAMLIIPLVLLFTLSVISLGNVGLSLTPQMTSDDSVSLTLSMDPGTSSEVIRERVFAMQDVFLEVLPAEAYESISLSTGSGMGSSATGSITVNLPDITMQTYSASEVENIIRPYLNTAADESWTFSGSRGMGSNAIDVEIRSTDTELARQTADEIVRILRMVEGTDNVESDLDNGAPQIVVRMKDDEAQALGVTNSGISSALTTALSGTTAVEITTFSSDTTYDLDVVLSGDDLTGISGLNSILIPTLSGSFVRLDTVAELETTSAPLTITRENKERVNHVTADALEGYSSSDLQAAVNEALDTYLVVPEGVTITQAGEMADFASYGPVLVIIVLLALFLVYAVMAAQFESLVDPFIIFATIPLLLIGVVFIHIVYNQDFTLFSLVGIIALIGVVVNNGIVLVDWINRLVRVERMGVREACLSAARSRLRPILMTTLTTILGLIPLAFFPGEGTEMIQPIALTFVGGITTGAFLTLLLSPVLYSIFNRKRALNVDKPDSLQNQLLEYDERVRKGLI